MTKEEMKNRISLALKDPMLQQGFEIICKNLAKLESRNDKLVKWYNERSESDNSFQQSLYKNIEDLEKENAELKTRVANQKSFLLRIQAKFNLGKIDRKEIEGFLESEQLAKAKAIIKRFSEFVNNEVEYDPEHPQEHTDLWNELCKEAEQFLKEVSE